jgi:hypothetical protein
VPQLQLQAISFKRQVKAEAARLKKIDIPQTPAAFDLAFKGLCHNGSCKL